jgi:hypothetical protein
VNAELARFAIVHHLESRRGELSFLLRAFRQGNSEPSELRFQGLEDENGLYRSVDTLSEGGDGSSGNNFGPGIASVGG